MGSSSSTAIHIGSRNGYHSTANVSHRESIACTSDSTCRTCIYKFYCIWWGTSTDSSIRYTNSSLLCCTTRCTSKLLCHNLCTANSYWFRFCNCYCINCLTAISVYCNCVHACFQITVSSCSSCPKRCRTSRTYNRYIRIVKCSYSSVLLSDVNLTIITSTTSY